jgi:hypothetical protein
MASNTGLSTVRVKYDIADLSIALTGGLALAFVVLYICVVPLTNIAGSRDFVTYWATGQQLVHHANPYDSVAMKRIEHEAGLPSGYTVGFMRNPPWGLPLALPLGLMGLRTGAFLWSLLLLACLLSSVLMLRRMYGSPGNYLHWLGWSFAPALLTLTMGQTSLFSLLGYVLFLRLHRSRQFLAGISLWLCALKPHLFLIFGVVLLAWILVSRSYKILAGVAFAMAISCAATTCIYPAAWSEYAQMIRTVGIEKEFIPCLSIVLRFWLSPQMMVLQYLPAALGCAWGLIYFWKRCRAWDWMSEGSLLLLISILFAPYCWLIDQCLAIPALLQGAYVTRFRSMLIILASANLILEIELMSGVKLPSVHYLWTAPAWLAWYLCAIGFKRMATNGYRRDTQIADPPQ